MSLVGNVGSRAAALRGIENARFNFGWDGVGVGKRGHTQAVVFMFYKKIFGHLTYLSIEEEERLLFCVLEIFSTKAYIHNNRFGTETILLTVLLPYDFVVRSIYKADLVVEV